MILLFVSVAWASCWAHGCVFTSAHLYSWYWQSWCKCGELLNLVLQLV